MVKLKIIIASTRNGRKGPAIAQWISDALHRQFERFDISFLDLKEINLPFLDEPENPKRGEQAYRYDHTKKWSAAIKGADALLILTPEYNGFIPGSLKNALDFLYYEWEQKPVGIVSYGGGSGGSRAAAQLKTLLHTLHMNIMPKTVNIYNFPVYFDANGNFKEDTALTEQLYTLGAELAIATE